MTVVHCKKDHFDVYIGRHGANHLWEWGNPFTHLDTKGNSLMFHVATRDEAVDKFHDWLINSEDARAVWMRNNIHRLEDKVLGCWCAPNRCHGTILAFYAELNKYMRNATIIDTRIKEEVMTTDTKPLYVIGWTGHRPNKLGGYQPNNLRNEVKKAMRECVEGAIAKYGDTHEIVFVTGGALGVDQWAASLANYLGLRHAIIIPFNAFEDRWPEASKVELSNLISSTDRDLTQYVYEYVSSLPKTTAGTFKYPGARNHGTHITMGDSYSRQIYQVRNEAMVDVSDAMISVWDGTDGGTGNCVKYIRETHTPMKRIDPSNWR